MQLVVQGGTDTVTSEVNFALNSQLNVRSDGDPASASVSVPFALNPPLKVGQLSFSQQDMIIPVAGMPLSVIRTYNSFNNATDGDFGRGWTWV